MKKRKIVIILFIFVAALVSALCMFKQMGSKEQYIPQLSDLEQKEVVTSSTTEYICLVNSQEEAERVANDYGIEFVSFQEGVAVLKSEKSYQELLDYGQEKGLVTLSVNNLNKAFGSEDNLSIYEEQTSNSIVDETTDRLSEDVETAPNETVNQGVTDEELLEENSSIFVNSLSDAEQETLENQTVEENAQEISADVDGLVPFDSTILNSKN